MQKKKKKKNTPIRVGLSQALEKLHSRALAHLAPLLPTQLRPRGCELVEDACASTCVGKR